MNSTLNVNFFSYLQINYLMNLNNFVNDLKREFHFWKNTSFFAKRFLSRSSLDSLFAYSLEFPCVNTSFDWPCYFPCTPFNMLTAAFATCAEIHCKNVIKINVRHLHILIGCLLMREPPSILVKLFQ